LILLDTHVLLWYSEGAHRLAGGPRARIEEAFASGEAAVSAISFWEIAMLVRKHRLEFAEPVSRWVARLCAASQVHVENVSWEIAVAGGDFSDDVHGDPIDRIIIATARHYDWPLVTADRAILAYAKQGHFQVIDASL
jgi:PIN domain nuclease of toxin-antitoxin system